MEGSEPQSESMVGAWGAVFSWPSYIFYHAHKFSSPSAVKNWLALPHFSSALLSS